MNSLYLGSYQSFGYQNGIMALMVFIMKLLSVEEIRKKKCVVIKIES